MAEKFMYILDVESSKLRLIVNRQINNNFSKVMTVIEREYSGFSDSDFFEKEKIDFLIQDMINECVRRVRRKINTIYVGVPSEFCVCLCKRINSCFIKSKMVTQKDISNLFAELGSCDSQKYQTINVSPMKFVLDDDVVVVSPIKLHTQKISMDASFVLASNSFVEIFNNALIKCNIKNIEYMSTTLSQAIMIQNNITVEPSILLDIGHITTTLAVIKGEGLAMLNSFSLGGGHITADLMQILKISYQDADILKKKAKLTIIPDKEELYEYKVGDRVVSASIQYTNDIIKSRIESIAVLINQLLNIDEIYKNIPIHLTGDGVSNFKGIKELLGRATDREIQYFTNNDISLGKYQTSIMGLINLAKQIKTKENG